MSQSDTSSKDNPEPPKWKMMIAKWAALLPALMIVNYGIKWLPIDPVLWLKLVMSATIIVPLMEYVLTPIVEKLMHKWMYGSA